MKIGVAHEVVAFDGLYDAVFGGFISLVSTVMLLLLDLGSVQLLGLVIQTGE